MKPAIDNAVREVAGTLSFLPRWAVAAIVLALAVVASLVVHWALGRLTRPAFDLRCDVREQLIAFLRDQHPESLPRSRNETVEPPVADRRALESEPSRRAAGAR